MSRETDYFHAFVAAMKEFHPRPEILHEETPAPQKLAPFSFAVSADVVLGLGSKKDETDLATGRFVLLHDPQGQFAWDGNFRCVSFVRAAIDKEMAAEPALTEVAWSWFLDALKTSNAQFRASSGTVTRVASSSFGAISGNEDNSEIEIRASWTPGNSKDLMSHIHAWVELLAIASALPPLPEGVPSLHQ